MGQVTHDQANLMLRLYEMRREPRLRQAREWFVARFNAASPEEMLQKYPPGGEENTNIRMVVSYWEMCCSLVNRGLIDDELFFENNGEAWLVWEKIRHMAPQMRQMYKNPTSFRHLEELNKRLEAWREKVAPGANDALRERFRQMAEAQAKARSAS